MESKSQPVVCCQCQKIVIIKNTNCFCKACDIWMIKNGNEVSILPRKNFIEFPLMECPKKCGQVMDVTHDGARNQKCQCGQVILLDGVPL